jgi:hypothetical protein
MFSKRLITKIQFMFCIFSSLAMAAELHAAPPGAVNAATQARANMHQTHQQSGTIGGGYRPWSAWTYTNSARTHVDTLAAYGNHAQQLPAATAQEHLTEIQRNLDASKKELAKLGNENAQEADIKQQVDSIEKHLASADKMCSMMEKNITKDGVASKEMCAHCLETSKELKAAESETLLLMKTLGIELPPASQIHHEHGQSPTK